VHTPQLSLDLCLQNLSPPLACRLLVKGCDLTCAPASAGTPGSAEHSHPVCGRGLCRNPWECRSIRIPCAVLGYAAVRQAHLSRGFLPVVLSCDGYSLPLFCHLTTCFYQAHLIHDHSSDHISTRLHAPPGGHSSMGSSFGWGAEEPAAPRRSVAPQAVYQSPIKMAPAPQTYSSQQQQQQQQPQHFQQDSNPIGSP